MSQRYLGGIITANPTLPTLSSASGVWTLEQDFQNSASITPQVIGRSVRLRSSASAYLNRTPASAGTRTAWTMSMWVKRGSLGTMGLFSTINSGTVNTTVGFNGDAIDFLEYQSATVARLVTTAVFRDPSAWYHLVFVWDTSNATSTDRVRIYVNGVRMTSFSGPTYPSLNLASIWNNNVSSTIGTYNNGAPPQLYLDGYTSEVNFVDGQALTPSSFGAFDANGIWQPLSYRGTYGTNGFYLNFSDNSAATATTIGKDYSGNGNNWTPNNISVTAGVTYDSMIDVPTNSASASNYATLNPLGKSSTATVTEGNLALSNSTLNTYPAVSAGIYPTSGSWYFEVTFAGSGTQECCFGMSNLTTFASQTFQTAAGNVYWNSNNGIYKDGAVFSGGAGKTFTYGDVLGVAYDIAAGTITFYKNNVAQTPVVTGVGASYAPTLGFNYYTAGTLYLNCGQRPFAYTPPTGFLALNTQNLPAVTVNNGAQYFDSLLWTSTATVKDVTGSNFQPDLVWVKSRASASANEGYHHLVDAVRGAGKVLSSNVADAEYWTGTNNSVQAFLPNGFTAGDSDGLNGNAMVSWLWKESVTAGFDIVTFTAPASGNFTINHSLGVVPSMIIVKDRSGAVSWVVGHESLPNQSTYSLSLNQTIAQQSNTTVWGNTAPTSTQVTLGVGGAVNANDNGVAYLFAEVAGFSAFGKYTGNGSADGPFVYCGFRPRFVMVKRTDTVGNWLIWDTARNAYNATDIILYPNLSNAESSGVPIDTLSNGFKVRDTSTSDNASGGTYIFAAFAENPFNIARAR